MKRRVDALILMAFLSLLALLLFAHAPCGKATAKPRDHAVQRRLPPPDGPMTKFDLLFSEPELAR
jgi:hypothetical protein